MLGACAALLSQLGSCQLSSQLGSVYLLAWILDWMLGCRGLLGVGGQKSLRGLSCAACWGRQKQCGWVEAHTQT